MKALKIGEVARRSGVAVDTIRYYEREGLLREPDRLPSGYRRYDESTIDRLEYIRRAKVLGFTLAEIRELLELSRRPGCGEPIRLRARRKLADIEEEIQRLRAIERSLAGLLESCTGSGRAGCCPLAHAAPDPDGNGPGPLPPRTS